MPLRCLPPHPVLEAPPVHLLMPSMPVAPPCQWPPPPCPMCPQVIAKKESVDSLRDVLVMLRNTSNPQVEYIVRTVQKWCKANNLVIS